MLRFLFSAGTVCTWCLICLGADCNPAQAWEQPATPVVAQPQDSATSPDEAAIREAGKAFAAAFNANDAKAIGAQWAEDGVFVDESGERIDGREAIQKQYEKFFSEYPGVQILVNVSQVKMVTPTTAIVEGTTTLGATDAKSPVSSQYLAVRVKSNGKWLLASAHDMRTIVEEKVGNLQDLESMIGTWQMKTDQTTYQTTCRWIENKKFVERKFTTSENGKVISSGTQIIGVDPMSKQITSWLFDSTGAHDAAIWTNYPKGWVVESNGIMADGTPTSAVNLLKRVDENSIAFKSMNRKAGEQSLPDTDEVVLKRVSQTESGR
jgi:uncharacterized protein (TIGR02246 family)